MPVHQTKYYRHSVSPHAIHHRHSYSPPNNYENDKVSRRPRTSITLYQRDLLEHEFQKERYPTLVYIDKLSRKIQLPQYVIKVSDISIFLFHIIPFFPMYLFGNYTFVLGECRL